MTGKHCYNEHVVDNCCINDDDHSSVGDGVSKSLIFIILIIMIITALMMV